MMRSLIQGLNRLLSRIPPAVALLGLRLFPAMVFLQSGQTKVDGLRIKDATWFLFEHEYALPLIPPDIAAVAATLAEHLLPALMIVGLLTRFSALGLLAMTAVIQIFVYPGAWVTHGLWASALLAVVAFGPGPWSLDRRLALDRGAA
jgi:putative oxidoreductase